MEHFGQRIVKERDHQGQRNEFEVCFKGTEWSYIRVVINTKKKIHSCPY
jgi:hypothetical protein